MKTPAQRHEERRKEQLELIEQQIKDGTLVVRADDVRGAREVASTAAGEEASAAVAPDRDTETWLRRILRAGNAHECEADPRLP